MRTFYTASDIEDLAARGARQLELGPGVMLTAAAKERAEELHITLVIPGNAAAASKTAVPARSAQSTGAAENRATAPSGALPAKPKGCQHGSQGSASSQAAPSPVVEQLVDAVSALKKRGG